MHWIAQSRKIVDDFKLFAKLVPYFAERWHLVAGAFMLVPCVAVLQVLQPLLLKRAIDDGILQGDDHQLVIFAAILLGVISFEYLCRLAQSMLSVFAVQGMIVKLRNTLVAHVLRLPAKFHDNHMSGALVTRVTSDFDNLSESLAQGFFSSIVDLVILIACLVTMFTLNFKLALIVFFLLPFIGLLIGWFAGGIKRALLTARSHLAASNGFAQECLVGIATLKSLVAERYSLTIFSNLNRQYRDAQVKSVSIDAFLYSILDGLASVVMGVVLWAILQPGLGGDASAGLIVAFVRLLQQLFDPLKQLGSTMALLQGVFTALERIFTLLDNQDRISGDRPALVPAGEVIFEDLSFCYGNNLPMILKNVSFTLLAGQSMAIIGRTGSGKTTIVKLITKMYQGYQGSIFIDGQEIAQIGPEHIRKEIAFVPQDIVLFTGSLGFNVSLGRTGISDEAVERVFMTLGVPNFLKGLPGGINFQIAEQGANLSQGQKQLIVFARAMVIDPKLVILDEATSVVDPATEQMLQNSLQKLLKGRTAIIIAHRLKTISSCDQILVFDQGSIIESGTHHDLIGKAGIYQKMYHSAQVEQ